MVFVCDCEWKESVWFYSEVSSGNVLQNKKKTLQYQKTGIGKIGALCPVSVEKRRYLTSQARKVRKQEKPSERAQQVGTGWLCLFNRQNDHLILMFVLIVYY